MSASQQFQQKLNSILLNSLHCFNHAGVSNEAQLPLQHAYPIQHHVEKCKTPEATKAGENLLAFSSLKDRTGVKRTLAPSSSSSSKRRVVGGHGSIGGGDGGGWSVDDAFSADRASGWCSWRRNEPRTGRALSPFAANGDGGGTTSSIAKSDGGGGGGIRSAPRREVRVRGRISRWDSGSEFGSRPQEEDVWRRNVHLPLPPHGSLSPTSDKARGSSSGSGNFVVGLEQVDQGMAKLLDGQATEAQRSPEFASSKPYPYATRSEGAAQIYSLPPKYVNLERVGSPPSAVALGNIHRGGLSSDDRIGTDVSPVSAGIEEDFNSPLGHVAPALKAPRGP